jgi:hypothetical protein
MMLPFFLRGSDETLTGSRLNFSSHDERTCAFFACSSSKGGRDTVEVKSIKARS